MRSEIVGADCEAEALDVLRLLRLARTHLAGGYSPCLSRLAGPAGAKVAELDDHMKGYTLQAGVLRAHAAGAICSPFDEGVYFYDLWGALQVAAAGRVDAQIVAGDLIVRTLDPQLEASRFELAGGVTLPTLIGAFDRAVLRAQAVSRRKD